MIAFFQPYACCEDNATRNGIWSGCRHQRTCPTSLSTYVSSLLCKQLMTMIGDPRRMHLLILSGSPTTREPENSILSESFSGKQFGKSWTTSLRSIKNLILEKTVLVLGAGASNPYGFPLGSELNGIIGQPLRDPDSEAVSIRGRLSTHDWGAISDFGQRISRSPLSVDGYLEHHPSVHLMGSCDSACPYSMIGCR